MKNVFLINLMNFGQHTKGGYSFLSLKQLTKLEISPCLLPETQTIPTNDSYFSSMLES